MSKAIVIYKENITLADEMAGKLADEMTGKPVYKSIPVVHIGEFDLDKLSDIACVYVEWNCRFEFYRIAYPYLDNLRIFFFNELFTVDVDDHSDIDRIRDKALADGNYKLCKSINEFYAISDAIRHREITKAYPEKIQLETTDLCNAKCIMCSHSYEPGSGTDVLKNGILDRLSEVLPYLKTIILHGNGEPFLKANISEYLDILSGYGIRFITNSNMSILTDDILRHLKDNFDELNVSCDGHNRELYEAVRVGLDYDTFVSNVKRVRSECDNLHMRMMVVLMKSNVPYMADMVSFASELGFDEINFNILCTDSKIGNEADSPLLIPDELSQNAEAAILRGEQLNIRVIAPYLKNDSQAESLQSRQQELGKTNKRIDFNGICSWLIEGPYINLRGDASICCMCQSMILGNVFEQDFDKVWNGDYYKHFRKCFYDGVMPAFCNGCDFVLQNRLEYLNVNLVGPLFYDKKQRD